MSGTLRHVCARLVAANGAMLQVSGLEWQVSRLSGAGSFAARLAVSADTGPALMAVLTSGRVAIDVSLAADPLSGGWSRVLVGQVDRLQWSPLDGSVICEGRDLTANLIEYRVDDGYLNQTSSDIATALAGACGLTAQVVPTSRMVGQYYQIEHRRSSFVTYSGRTTAWDILNELALIEGYRLYVQLETLFFVPLTQDAALSEILTLTGDTWSSGTGRRPGSVELTMLPGIAATPSVRVRSWNSRQRMLVDTAPASSSGQGASGVYDVVRPNMTSDDAASLSTMVTARIAAQSLGLVLTLPGELGFQPAQLLRITGTGTGWDQTYQIDDIERSITVSGGFQQTVTASLLGQD